MLKGLGKRTPDCCLLGGTVQTVHQHLTPFCWAELLNFSKLFPHPLTEFDLLRLAVAFLNQGEGDSLELCSCSLKFQLSPGGIGP